MIQFLAAKVPKILTVTGEGIAIFIPLLKNSCQSRSRAWSSRLTRVRIKIDNDNVNRASCGEVFVPDVPNHNLTLTIVPSYHRSLPQEKPAAPLQWCRAPTDLLELPQQLATHCQYPAVAPDQTSRLLRKCRMGIVPLKSISARSTQTQTLKSDTELIRII